MGLLLNPEGPTLGPFSLDVPHPGGEVEVVAVGIKRRLLDEGAIHAGILRARIVNEYTGLTGDTPRDMVAANFQDIAHS